MLLKEVCTPEIACCGPHTHALEAARLMRQKHVGDLIVVDDPEDERIPLGVVTDRDLVIEVLGKGLDPATTNLASVMRKPVVIARESEDTREVIERMRTHGVRRVPVVNDHGSAVGIITLDDLLGLFVQDATLLMDVVATGQKHERRVAR
jgi:CBS domain-containing protein